MFLISLLKNKWALAAGAVLIAILVSGWLGYDYASSKCAEERLRAVQRAIAEAEKRQSEIDEIELEYLEKEAEKEVIYKTITEEVIRYVEVQPDNPTCIDANGVRLLNSALKGKVPE